MLWNTYTGLQWDCNQGPTRLHLIWNIVGIIPGIIRETRVGSSRIYDNNEKEYIRNYDRINAKLRLRTTYLVNEED